MAALKRKHTAKIVATALAIGIIVLGGTGGAYAANVGGVQRTVQTWMYGELTDTEIVFDGNGNYELTFTDVDGREHTRGGGGIAYDMFGKERPLTEEELMEELSMPEIIPSDDGRIIVYYYDQVVDITDMFKNNKCYVSLVNKKTGENIYLTVKKDKDGSGFSYSTGNKKFER